MNAVIDRHVTDFAVESCYRCGGYIQREVERCIEITLVYDRCLNCGEYYEIDAYPTNKVSKGVSTKIHSTAVLDEYLHGV